MTDVLAEMAAFAEARLAEDEADAQHIPTDTEWYARFQPAAGHGRAREMAVRRTASRERLLAGVGGDRKLLAEIAAMPHLYLDGDAWYSCSQATHPDPCDEDDGGPGSGCLDETRTGKPCDCGRDSLARRLLAALVMRWEGHPEYKAGEWAA